MAYARPILAVSEVATAPSPATSGTSLVLTAGHGASRFGSIATPFWVYIGPLNVSSHKANTELCLATLSTDTLTLVRAQQGTSARSIIVGDAVYAGPSPEDFAIIRETYIDAGAWVPLTTNGAAATSYEPSGGDSAKIDAFAFDDTTAEKIQFKFKFPRKWDRSTLKYKVDWTSVSGTGNVEWKLSAGAISDDDAWGAILGTAIAVIDTVLASDDRHLSPASAALTVGGSPALDDMVLFQLERNPGTASDKTGDALALGIMIQYTELAVEPAAW